MQHSVASFGRDLLQVDYASYLSQHDVVYETPPAIGCHGLPIGNGVSGALVWTPPTAVRWELGGSDLWADGPARPFGSWNKEDEEVATALLSAGSLSIGYDIPAFDWAYLKKFSARLSLFPAEVSLNAETPFSRVRMKTWMNSDPSCLIIQWSDDLDEAIPRKITLERWGSRVFAHWYRTIVRDPSRGLGGTEASVHGDVIILRHSSRSHDFVVAAKVAGVPSVARAAHRHAAVVDVGAVRSAEFTVLLTIASSETTGDPLQTALERIANAEAAGVSNLQTGHRRWWAGFWERSFVNIPDAYLENLWYINQYVMGSSSRGDYPPHFINGIWNWNRDFRAWNHFYHWNQEELNWPVFASGHPELALGYLKMRAKALPLAQQSAMRKYGIDGAWYSDVYERRGWQDEGVPLFTPGLQIALDMWRYWRHTGDEQFLAETAYPVMREACRFYLGMLKEESDGLFHLPASHPYEHASGYMVRDCLTDMAHIRTAFPATAAVAERLGEREFAERLRDVAARLPRVETLPLPERRYRNTPGGAEFTDGWAKGLKCPSDRILCVGRRVEDGRPVHFRAVEEGTGSDHLFPGSDESLVFPSGALGLRDKGSELFEAARTTALCNWEEIMGWSVTPIVFARLGMSDLAEEALRRHIIHFQHFPQGLWNYQGSQSGSATDFATTFRVHDREDERDEFPFLRQPHTHFGLEPGAVVQTTVNEMFLQSYDGVIRVCPSVPQDWDGAFSLWAEGGFRVSARVLRGRVPRFAVESMRGEECRIVLPYDGAWEVTDGISDATLDVNLEGDMLTFPTATGGVYMISDGNEAPSPRPLLSGCAAMHAKEREGRWIGIPRMW